MKKGWEVKSLKEIGITQTGTTPKTSEKENYGDFIPFIKPADIDINGNGEIRYDNEGKSEQGLKNGRKMIEGSILMVCIGATIGKVGFADRDVSCNQQINSLTVKKELCPKFFYYALTTENFFKQVINNAAQATLPIINKNKWETLTVSYPKSLPEQHRIVSILDKAFASIATAKEHAEKNLKNAKEVFESYLTGVFEKRGDRWEEKRLGDVCLIKPPKDEARQKLKTKDLVSFVPMEDLGIGQMFLEPKKEKTLGEVISSYTYFADNDILLAKITPCFENGKIGIAKNLSNGIGFGSSEYIAFRPKNNIPSEFIYYFLSQENFRLEGEQRMTGAVGHKRLPPEFVQNYFIPLPSLSEQKRIVSQLESLSTETKKLESIYQQKLANLEELKKSILHKAFNGEL
ncbi:MAG: restriction endonuclease subunit S [Desulfobacterales bacterium]|nr:restriction endonuclease subunit S [Desulfobacterales bacterium]